MTPVSSPFQRGLSDAFISWLGGETGRELIDAFGSHGLDVRLRGDYFNAYRANCSVAKVKWQPLRRMPALEVSRKYLADASLLQTMPRGEYVRLDLSSDGCRAYRDALPAILRTVDKGYCSLEGEWERDCVASNLEGTPLLVIDRQVANGPARLDILAVATDLVVPALVAVEVKRDLDNRIQEVPDQAFKYLQMLDPAGDGLRGDIASSYRKVCGQLRGLGFKACDAGLIREGMPVLGLVALGNYNTKSKLLDRARERAQKLDRLVRFCFLDRARPTLPPPDSWFS